MKAAGFPVTAQIGARGKWSVLTVHRALGKEILRYRRLGIIANLEKEIATHA
jgi:hypothetical protein